MSHALVEARDVSFAYNGNTVIDRISFAIQPGDYVGIVGPNGGGKTTLLKLLIGLLAPSSGELLIDGVSIQRGRRTDIGYVPQRVAQDQVGFPATVQEVVESGRVMRAGLWGRFGKADRVAIEAALEAARITDLRDTLMSRLSGGQRQRAYVARALALEPRILLLDEPFVGIDTATQAEFYAFLKKLNVERGLTILFVSHDVDVMSEEVTSVLCLNKGLLCFGHPTLLHEPEMVERLYGRHVTHLHHEIHHA